VQEGLATEGIEAKIVPTLVRGLDYYTRTAFEFVSEVLSDAQATLFGGGRYDGLAEALGGPHVPGVGFGMGLERARIALEDEGLPLPEEPGLDVFVVAVGEASGYARDVMRGLRNSGLCVDASFEVRPLKGQLRMADRSGARFAAIVGTAEAAGGLVTVRRMADGDQKTVAFEEAVSLMSSGHQ
jgi:histidyl-tRNA synthetase